MQKDKKKEDEKNEEVKDKKEEARLEEAADERAAKERIKREKDIEEHQKTIAGLKKRQKFLDDLYKTLREEGINSIGDLEIKQARAQKDLEVEEKKVV